jgi:VanZ family protein
MTLSKLIINLFRLVLIFSIIIITCLAIAKIEFPAVEDINDKFSHLVAFYFLAFVLDFSFPRKHFDIRKVLLLLTYGFILELVQYNLPHREFSVFDLATDGIGILLYWLSIPLLRRFSYLKQRWE